MGHGLAAVALVVGAVEPRARHRDRVSAVKGGAPGDGTGVQRRRAGDELEHIAGLVQVAYRLVAPLGLLRQLQGGSALFTGKGIHGGACGLVGDHPGLVGVVGRGGGHGQHCPGVHLHHDAHAAGGYMMLLHRIIQRIFKVMLNICINGQPQPAALHGGKLGLVTLRQRVAPSVHGGQYHPILPGKGCRYISAPAR